MFAHRIVQISNGLLNLDFLFRFWTFFHTYNLNTKPFEIQTFKCLRYSNGRYSDPHCVWDGFSNCHVKTGLLKVLKNSNGFCSYNQILVMIKGCPTCGFKDKCYCPGGILYKTNKHWILEQKHRHKRSEQLCYANVSDINITRYSLFYYQDFLTWLGILH